MLNRFPTALISAAILAALASTGAYAQTDQGLVTTPSSIASVPHAPVTIESCKTVNQGISGDMLNDWISTTVVANRTSHQLVSASAQFSAFDSENAKLGQVTVAVPVNDAVASRETAVFPMHVMFPFNVATAKLVNKITCRIVDARFTANKRWIAGQKWTETLQKLNGQ